VLGLVILAGITKRAQMPFSAWLPAAIAAPTPVSALVHSSTLVTAGVYLLIRFNYMLGINNFLFYVGVFTIFMSGLGANFENDLKKIIALSTLRQLGLIIIVLSLGFYELSFFHLLTHALFKSLLFLCAGVFIHRMGDIQDIRHLGGASISCPATSFYFIGSSLALCGFPFLAGFYSKDLILEVYFIGGINIFMFVFIFLSTIFTLTYSVRLGYFIFFKNLGVKTFNSVEEELGILLPIRILFVLSVVAGSLISWFYFPIVFVLLPFFIKILVLISLLVLSLVIFTIVDFKNVQLIFYCRKIVFYSGTMWFLPFLSTIFFMPLIKLGEALIKFFDQGWLEQFGGQGFIFKMKSYSSTIDYLISLNVKNYLLIFLFIIVYGFIIFYLYSLKRAWR
jgi:NADH-ubiquinone oxidoreductase chain 5